VRVAVITLGEIGREEARVAAQRHFGGAEMVWADRRGLPALMRLRVDGAVLVARDLSEPRLRLTSLLLALPRAGQRWRIDLRGGRERWSLREHLQRNSVPVARHLAACALAAAIGEPLLRVVAASVKPRKSSRGRLQQVAASVKPRTLKRPPPRRVAASVNNRRGPGSVRPRRVLYLRSQLWLGLAGGGSVAHTAGVISGLQDCGADVTVVSSDALAGVSAPTRIVRPEVWFDGWLRELEDLAYNVAFFAAALTTTRQIRPDLIYQRHTAFNVASALLSRVLRLPFVLEFNSSEVWKGRYWGGLRLAGAARAVERVNLRAADRIIVVSDVLRDELTGQGVADCKIVVNPNGVDTRLFSPDISGDAVRHQLCISMDDVVIGFSGTFGVWHGVPTLVDAIPRVLQARRNARWLLIGDGPLRHLIPSEARVHAVGMLPHAQVPSYLAACDILVSPHGRQADGGEFFGSPTKLYEYMAMGRAIVASRVGQIGEVLADGESALLVEPEDADALASSIVRLVDDPCLRAKLGQTARAHAEARHTWRQNAERVLGALGGTC